MYGVYLNPGTGKYEERRLQCDADGRLIVSGAAGGGSGGASDTTEATQLQVLAVASSIDGKTPALVDGGVPVAGPLTAAELREFPVVVAPRNIANKFREAFERYTPGERWVESKAPGDLVFVDGNAGAASYLVISKDPLAAGTVTTLESVARFTMPIEVSAGLHMSQRTLGQEFFAEFVDIAPPTPLRVDKAIASISQTTTTLTINYSEPHGYTPGMRIGVMDVSDSRLNYPSLTVAAAPTPLQITCLATAAAALPSVTAGPFAGGYTYHRPALGGAQNGTSLAFETGTVTAAAFFVRSEAGDVLPTGVLASTHSATVSTSASVAAVTAPGTYAFQPTSEYRMTAFVDGVQWSDAPVDTLAATTSRVKRTQVVPDPAQTYKVRLRAVNNKALTVPTAQIVSVSKSGTTTATITFDRPHGLTTADVFVAYGVRDVVNFAPLAVATPVASVVNPTTITAVWGSAATATSYGGYAARVQGGNLMSALGAVAQSAQTAAVSTAADGVKVLALGGSAAWTGLLIGDLCNVIGLRDTATGATLGLDGAYRVRSILTTAIELECVDGAVLPADFAAVNCGGALIKRTDLRVSFVRVLDFDRQRVEVMARPAGDIASALPVAVQNTIPAVATVSAVTSCNAGLPGAIADVASAAIAASATTAPLIPTYGSAYEVSIAVSAVAGTTPTLDVVVQESDDTGLNWFDVYAFARITGIGVYRSPKLPLTGNRVRYVQTLGGVSPSFTRIVTRLQSSDTAAPLRQIFERAVSLTTLNAATAVLNTGAANSVQLVVSIGAATTPPALQLQGSEDGVGWYSIGAPLAAVASSTVELTVKNISADRVRAVVSTAGASVTAGYILIKAYGR